jgi:DNA-directed RNA polymerase specialized sigma24 family protein
MPSAELQQFLATLRGGDSQAVDEMMRQLDPFLRRIIHLRLIDGRLRHITDTADIFQSLLKDFLSQDHPSVETSAGLRAYLATAVHYKIQTRKRKERRHGGHLPDGWETVSSESPAGGHADDQDLCRVIRSRLPEVARRLFDLKAQGLTWAEIAAQVGGQSDALRMQLTRALAPILSELREGRS